MLSAADAAVNDFLIVIAAGSAVTTMRGRDTTPFLSLRNASEQITYVASKLVKHRKFESCLSILCGSMAYVGIGAGLLPERIRNRRSQRLTLVVIRKFSFTCSRPFIPMRRANSGCVSR